MASCVVFRDAKPTRKEYRHFNIQDRRWSQRLRLDGRGDRTPLPQVARRRRRTAATDRRGRRQGQLRFAYESLLRLGIADRVAIVGLAKRIEEVYFRTTPPLTISTATASVEKCCDAHTRRKRTVSASPSTASVPLAFIKSELGKHPRPSATVPVEKLLQRFRTLSRIGRLETELSELIGRQRAAEVIRYFGKCRRTARKRK